jgi:hypothetical protein
MSKPVIEIDMNAIGEDLFKLRSRELICGFKGLWPPEKSIRS